MNSDRCSPWRPGGGRGRLGGMKRRRAILIAVVPLVAIGAAWCVLVLQQYSIEQQLVGAWRSVDSDPGVAPTTYVIQADGRYQAVQGAGPVPPGLPPFYWSVRGNVFDTDLRARPIHPALRPLAAFFGKPGGTESSCEFEVTDHQLVFIQPDGSRDVFRRVPAD